jgi:hypothetical protein
MHSYLSCAYIIDDTHAEHKGIQFVLNFHKTGQFTVCARARARVCVCACVLMELYSNYSKCTQNHLEFVEFEVNLYKVTF